MTLNSLHSDQELLRCLADGDEQAFYLLYRRYSPLLYRNLLKLVKVEEVATELLQEIFLKLWEKRDSISVHKDFSGYIFMVSRNLVIDFFRKARREKDLYDALLEHASRYEIPDQLPDLVYQDEVSDKLLHEAITSLPPIRAKVFRLCKVDGLTYAETGKHLGISVSTVSDHMVKATKHIREYLSKHQTLLPVFFILLLGE